MRLIYLVLLLAPTSVFAACPEITERTERHQQLMDQVAKATNETMAQELNNQLWEVWATAPDETAQEILQRGMERRASYDFAGAVDDFNALIDYCPNYAEGYNQRAFVNFILGDYETSLADLNRALAITPDHIGALTGRALALMQLGRNQEGQVVLREALKLNPWLPERNRLEPLENPSQKEL